MTETYTIDGTDYVMNGNPSLRTVRDVQSMQMDLIRQYVDEDQLMEMDSLEDESEIVQAIIESEGFEAFQDVMWKRSMLEPVQTISLACDEAFDPDDFDDMGALDFESLKDDAEESLEGDASDFFNRLGIGTFLSEKEMQQQAQAARET